jgi:hypothetical protein
MGADQANLRILCVSYCEYHLCSSMSLAEAAESLGGLVQG